VDDRTMVAALGGALLVASSAIRVQRTDERSIKASVMRDLRRYHHSWWRRMRHAGAVMGGSVGLVLLVYAARSEWVDARRRSQLSDERAAPA